MGSSDRGSGGWKAAVPAGADSAPAAAVSESKWEAGAARTDSSSSFAAVSESKLKASAFSGRIRIVQGDAPAEPSVVAITSRSHDEVLEYTHAFVAAYTRRRFRTALAAQLSVATYELLENALNYGSVVGEIDFQIAETPRWIAIRVSNDTVQVRLDMMRTHLERMNRDPEAAFVEEMRRSMASGGGRAMLGLARIVHEAKLSLEAYMSASRVTVIARAPF